MITSSTAVALVSFVLLLTFGLCAQAELVLQNETYAKIPHIPDAPLINPGFKQLKNAPWFARSGAVFGEVLGGLLIGGGTGASRSRLNDYWISSDAGVSWNPAGKSTIGPSIGFGQSITFTPSFSSAVLPPQLVAFQNNRNLYSTLDGISWSAFTTNLPNSDTFFATLEAVYDSTMSTSISVYFMGGTDGNGNYFRNLYTSKDLRTWELLGVTPWNNRIGMAHTTVERRTRMVVAGGQGDRNDYYSDVWISSIGGLTWTQLPQPQLTNRALANMVNVNDYLYIFGGKGLNSANQLVLLNDVWISTDHGETFMLFSQNNPTTGTVTAYYVLDRKVIVASGEDIISTIKTNNVTAVYFPSSY